MAPADAQAPAQAPQRGAQAGAPAGQGRGGPGDPFAGQPRIKALIVSGGCCHDYTGEAKVLIDTVSKVLPVDWTVAVQGGRGTVGHISLYDNPNWISGFDIVIHNECFADVVRPGLSQEDHRRAQGRSAGNRDSLFDALVPCGGSRRLAGVSRRHQPSAHDGPQHRGEDRRPGRTGDEGDEDRLGHARSTSST